MARYIDAEKLEKKGWSASRTYPQDAHTMVYETKKMTDFPTADVVERKHGRWLPYEFGSKRWHKCSVCGKADEYINERGIEAVRKFCPNCGAEMRE